MSRTVITAIAFAAIFVVFTVVKNVREDITIGPAREAVLAITTDTVVEDASLSAIASAAGRTPNIILIVADDLGWRDVGYNTSEIRTPVIDRLANEGIKLNRFYVQPSCSPTRAALLTGKSPLRLGIINPLTKNNPRGLPLEEKTIADRLRGAGYQTALVGKWHLGARNLAYHPNERGFDYFYGHVTGGISYYAKVHGGGYDWQRNGKTVREEGYTTHLIAQDAVRQIEERDPRRPLFLYAAFGAPHLPNEAPHETIESYTAIENEHRRVHAAMVTEMDQAVGDIHAALVREGIETETLIWFMSDNGGLIVDNPARFLPDILLKPLIESRLGVKANQAMLDFARKNFTEGGSDNRPFRAGKGSIYEGGVRVPAFMYWPGQLSTKAYNHMVTVQDVMPTLLNTAGVTAEDTVFDGRDLLLSLETGSRPPQADYITKINVIADSTALYRYPYKLLKIADEVSLFDVESDPLETSDIAAQYPDIVAELATRLDAFPEVPSIAIPSQQAIDDIDLFGGEEDRKPWAEQAYWTN